MQHIQKTKYKNRWISYFDLLGFRELIKENAPEIVINVYKEVLKELGSKTSLGRKYGIDKSWFSDSFLIYSKDDTPQSFVLIESASRLFFQKMVKNKRPLRGALSIGHLFTNKRDNIFIGQALIDAYVYAEKQDWIGFILTPMAYKWLKESQFSSSNNTFNYKFIDVPIKKKRSVSENEKLFALTSRSLPIRNQLLSALSQMEQQARPEHKQKIQNTITFINQTQHFISP